MKYYVTVNGRARVVELVERSGALHVSVDGEELAVDFQEVDRLGQVALSVGDRSHAVSIADDGADVAVTLAGRFYRVEIEDERERAAHAAEREHSKRGGVVKSVMPGVVVSLLVAVGDEVAEGQALLILEAMKMQNEIRAPSAGVVEAIHVSEGQAVASGTRLVTLR